MEAGEACYRYRCMVGVGETYHLCEVEVGKAYYTAVRWGWGTHTASARWS